MKIKVYETIILPFVICGCETMCVTLKTERGLAVVGYGKIEKLHNEYLNGLYTSPDFMMIKRRRIRWFGDLVHIV